ncbi:unnamed protein product [Cylicocyclus nassatus]|uniref:Uncharacterized protein n=1 Tax=Cylicocyclus nassatus TaxID=53992 RepID=A0AA36H0Y8_CYLNA|nr:unnamed protein product [Cylicocyclus nassatus]
MAEERAITGKRHTYNTRVDTIEFYNCVRNAGCWMLLDKEKLMKLVAGHDDDLEKRFRVVEEKQACLRFVQAVVDCHKAPAKTSRASSTNNRGPTEPQDDGAQESQERDR